MTDLFADKAANWDDLPVPQAISAGVSHALRAHVALDDTLEVMDFGAGTGLISSAIAPHVGRIWAVDVSAGMLASLAAKPALAGKVETVCQNIITTPLARRFDLIVSAMAAHHVQDTDALVARFAEHLKPGGRLALADLDKEDGSFHPAEAEGVFHPGFERSALGALLQVHGFEAVQFHTAVEINKEGRTYPVFLVTATLA